MTCKICFSSLLRPHPDLTQSTLKAEERLPGKKPVSVSSSLKNKQKNAHSHTDKYVDSGFVGEAVIHLTTGSPIPNR